MPDGGNRAPGRGEQDLRPFIDELKSRVDIVAAMSPFVKLQRRGNSYVGLCPFHEEKTPSFHVRPDRNHYNCFGCGAHGDVISFLQHFRYGGDFMDTLRGLASDNGMELPSRGSKGDRFGAQRELLESAAKLYRRHLKNDRPALEYLKSRGISPELAERFEMGSAPNEWAFIRGRVKDAQKRKMMADIGLLKTKEKGSESHHYDAFRGRLMFPIRDERGKMVGFGGRTLVGDDAKYLNSPQSAVFDKGRLLYGLHQSLAQIRQEKRAVLVEGYTDVVALSSYGIGIAAAPMGTALTRRQLEVVLRYADQVVFCFDGDAAGLGAADKALEVAMGVITDGKGASFLFLPDGEDPDSFVRQKGEKEFMRLVDAAEPISEFLVSRIGSRGEGQRDEIEKVRHLQEVTELIERMDANRAPFLRETFYASLSQKTGMSQDGLRQAAERARAQRERYRRDGRSGTITKDGIYYRLLDCFNSRPDLVRRVPELPLLGNPEEVEFFIETYKWLEDRKDDELKQNLLANHLEEEGHARLAFLLRDSARYRTHEVDPVKTFEQIASNLRMTQQSQEKKRKLRDEIKRAVTAG